MEFSHELAMVLYQSAEPFAVDFDDAWRWIGWRKKQDGKDVLLQNFKEGEDFLRKGVKSPSGGRPGEWIALTVNCFKQLGMMAGTEKGRNIRDYFIECERRWKEESSRQSLIQPTAEHPEPKVIIDSVSMVLSIAGINPNLIAGVAANAVADYYPALKPAMELVKKELPIAIEEKLVTVTDLAAVYSDRVGRKVTAQAMNKLLQEAGLQEPTGSKNPAWQPTARGAEFGQVILNTAKGHDRTVQQLRWYPSVIDQLAS